MNWPVISVADFGAKPDAKGASNLCRGVVVRDNTIDGRSYVMWERGAAGQCSECQRHAGTEVKSIVCAARMCR